MSLNPLDYPTDEDYRKSLGEADSKSEVLWLPPEPDSQPDHETGEKEHPQIKGWFYSRCRRVLMSHLTFEEATRLALEELYTAVAPTGNGIKLPPTDKRRQELLGYLDEIAVELLGGVPEGWEEFV